MTRILLFCEQLLSSPSLLSVVRYGSLRARPTIYLWHVTMLRC